MSFLEVLVKEEDKRFLSKEKCVQVLEKIYLSRFIDQKMNVLVKQNKGTTFFLSSAGHEMVGAVAALSLKPGIDWCFPYYRDKTFTLALGSSPIDIMSAFLAREGDNHSKGRMMLDHFSQPSLRIPCQSSVVGSQFLQSVGKAKAIQLEGKEEVVYVSAGDGATSQGDFHEALNFSSLHQLPIIFVIQDNRFAISVPAIEQTAGGSIAKVFQGYKGIKIFDVNGVDYIDMSTAMKEAVDRARMKKGPSLIVANVPRLNSHTSSDDQKKYKSDDVIAEEQTRDPVILFEKLLLQQEYVTEKDIFEMKERIKQEVEEISIKAEKLPFPKKEDVEKHVFKPFSILSSSKEEEKGEKIVMMDGLNHALKEEMEKDPHVIVFGQDVKDNKGGVFGITRGLTNKFGIDRCFNSPLAESTIVGVAIGMSFGGIFKPVVEIQFIDYVWTAMNQLVNELASIYYRSSGQWHCPLVVRMPYGGYIQGGPYHSQSIEAIFTHIPGLKVVVPSNASDAKRLLKTAIVDPNPVVFLEHKALYRQQVFCAREEPGKDDYLPFGQANIVKEGTDATIVAWGMMVPMAYEVAMKLEKENINVEVIDLRTLVPLDFESILNSLKKTNKLLIVHEACENCGFGAEIAAKIAEKGFCFLDAPVMRVAGKNCPVSYCKDLEDATLPQQKDIEQKVRELIAF